MASIRAKINNDIRLFNTLQRLILINIVLFCIVRLTNSFSSLFQYPVVTINEVYEYLGVPSNVSMILPRLWTFITYMFTHWDIGHIVYNMIALYVFGRILFEFAGGKKLLSIYLLGGIAGAVLFIIGMNVLPLLRSLPHTPIIGASGSVLAVLVAAATLMPNYMVHLFIIGEVRLKWIALVFILLDIISLGGAADAGHLAHLGGAVYGFMHITQLRKGRDMGAWLNRLFERAERKGRMRVEKSKRAKMDEEFNLNRKAKQERMDDILDKISKSGYGSLTQAEKDFLFQMSKENQQ
jgi:membrane associated rhomboid family serine protease